MMNFVSEKIGRYETTKYLGQGQFGIVYRAFDTLLEIDVALKATKDYPEGDNLERLLREARAPAMLRHRHIARTIDVIHDRNRICIVSDYIDGSDLQHRIGGVSEGEIVDRPSLSQAVEWARQLASALAHAASTGVIHRDVKPANILIETATNDLKLADFGLARRLGRDRRLTASGRGMGTPLYASPEQHGGLQERSAPTTDQYSLGVVFYELLTGTVPIHLNSDAGSWANAVWTTTPRPLREIDPTIPEALDIICLRCLAKRPEDRFPSCADVEKALAEWQTAEAERPRMERERRLNGDLAAALAGKQSAEARLEAATREAEEALEQTHQKAAITLADERAKADARFSDMLAKAEGQFAQLKLQAESAREALDVAERRLSAAADYAEIHCARTAELEKELAQVRSHAEQQATHHALAIESQREESEARLAALNDAVKRSARLEHDLSNAQALAREMARAVETQGATLAENKKELEAAASRHRDAEGRIRAGDESQVALRKELAAEKAAKLKAADQLSAALEEKSRVAIKLEAATKDFARLQKSLREAETAAILAQRALEDGKKKAAAQEKRQKEMAEALAATKAECKKLEAIRKADVAQPAKQKANTGADGSAEPARLADGGMPPTSSAPRRTRLGASPALTLVVPGVAVMLLFFAAGPLLKPGSWGPQPSEGLAKAVQAAAKELAATAEAVKTSKERLAALEGRGGTKARDEEFRRLAKKVDDANAAREKASAASRKALDASVAVATAKERLDRFVAARKRPMAAKAVGANLTLSAEKKEIKGNLGTLVRVREGAIYSENPNSGFSIFNLDPTDEKRIVVEVSQGDEAWVAEPVKVFDNETRWTADGEAAKDNPAEMRVYWMSPATQAETDACSALTKAQDDHKATLENVDRAAEVLKNALNKDELLGGIPSAAETAAADEALLVEGARNALRVAEKAFEDAKTKAEKANQAFAAAKGTGS